MQKIRTVSDKWLYTTIFWSMKNYTFKWESYNEKSCFICLVIKSHRSSISNTVWHNVSLSNSIRFCYGVNSSSSCHFSAYSKFERDSWYAKCPLLWANSGFQRQHYYHIVINNYFNLSFCVKLGARLSVLYKRSSSLIWGAPYLFSLIKWSSLPYLKKMGNHRVQNHAGKFKQIRKYQFPSNRGYIMAWCDTYLLLYFLTELYTVMGKLHPIYMKETDNNRSSFTVQKTYRLSTETPGFTLYFWPSFLLFAYLNLYLQPLLRAQIFATSSTLLWILWFWIRYLSFRWWKSRVWKILHFISKNMDSKIIYNMIYYTMFHLA